MKKANKISLDCPRCGEHIALVVADKSIRRAHTRPAPLGLIDEETAAAEYLHVSTRTLLRERQNGRIQFYRVGLKVYYKEEYLQAYLERSCASVAKKRPDPRAMRIA